MIYYEIVLYFIANSTEIMITEMAGMFTFDLVQSNNRQKDLELNNINHPYYQE